MRVKNKILSTLLAAVCTVSMIGMTAKAAEIQCDQQIPTSEVDSVYNQEVQSNALQGWPAGPNLYSESGIVMDMDSGAILYAKNIDDQHYPASITKIMTALVALENYQMTDTVKFTQDCISFLEYGDAHIGMKPDEEISMEDALYGMLLASANEVSYAIANTDPDGYQSFLDKMNQKAQELGCRNSHWMNANGLHDDEHYTSARDMALIGSAVFQYEEFRTVTSTRQHTIPATNLTSETRTFQQNHKMLYPSHQHYYEYCVGGKTGFTDQALTTLVTFATKDDKNLVAVTLRTHGGGQKAYVDTRAMMDYAFDNFTKVPITKEEITDKNIKEIAADSYVMLPQGVTLEQLDKTFEEPKAMGEKEGCFTYTYGGQEVGKVKAVITDKYYNKLHGIEEVKKEKKSSSKKSSTGTVITWVLTIVVVSIMITVFFVVNYRVERERERKRRMMRMRRKEQRMRNKMEKEI